MFSNFPILCGKKNFAPKNGPDMLQHISFYFPDAMRNQTSNRKYVKSKEDQTFIKRICYIEEY